MKAYADTKLMKIYAFEIAYGRKVDMLPLFLRNWFLYFKKLYAFATIKIIIFVSFLINMSSILFLSMLYHVFNLFQFFDLNQVCEVVREVKIVLVEFEDNQASKKRGKNRVVSG